MSKMVCEQPNCNKPAEYTVTTAKGNRKLLCKKHGQDILRTISQMQTVAGLRRVAGTRVEKLGGG